MNSERAKTFQWLGRLMERFPVVSYEISVDQDEFEARSLKSIPLIHQLPVVEVIINALVFEESPRFKGIDEAHVRALQETDASLSPILVHRETMRVIGGMHRVRASVGKGVRTIKARRSGRDHAGARDDDPASGKFPRLNTVSWADSWVGRIGVAAAPSRQHPFQEQGHFDYAKVRVPS